MPQVAHADCAHAIIDQAYKGSITSHYSQDCYTAAIRIEPVDGSSYSDLDAVIKDAKRADARRGATSSTGAGSASRRNERRTRPPGTTRSHPTTAASRPSPSPPTMLAAGGRNRPAAAERLAASSPPATVSETLLGAPPATPLLEDLAPAHAGDVPLAVIVLAVLAALLVLAGVAGSLVRRRAGRGGA